MGEFDMSTENYNYYIFRLGIIDGEQLYPTENETSTYRFLHEVGHAYQDFITHKESPHNPNLWYDHVVKDEIDSVYGLLFKFCLNKRVENSGKGLSTWGNVPDYNTIQDQRSQLAIRSVEDANELVTMYLWNPHYLNTFLDYLCGNIQGFSTSDVEKDGLLPLSAEEKEMISFLVTEYVSEMEENTADLAIENKKFWNRLHNIL